MTYGSGVSLAAASIACSATGATQPGSAAYNTACAELANVGQGIDEAIASGENSLSEQTIGGPADLLAATSLAGQLANLGMARGFANRAVINLANAAI